MQIRDRDNTHRLATLQLGNSICRYTPQLEAAFLDSDVYAAFSQTLISHRQSRPAQQLPASRRSDISVYGVDMNSGGNFDADFHM